MNENIFQFASAVAVSATLGAIIGFFCRGRVVLQLLLSVVVSVLHLVVGAWIAGTLSDQISLSDPIGTLGGTGVLYGWFLLLPTALSSIVVGWLRRRKLG